MKNREAKEALGVCEHTLRIWDSKGKIKAIRTAGGQRRYDVDSFLSDTHEPFHKTGNTPKQLVKFVAEKQANAKKENTKFLYCRVSSSKQRDDLQRQIQALQDKYPDHQVVTDIGSGLNFKRKGLQRLLDRCTSGDVEEIVVAHKDRLCRFGYEWLQWFFNKHNVSLIIQDDHCQSAEQELLEDLMAIVHVFSCRLHGKRMYKTTTQEILHGEKETVDKRWKDRGGNGESQRTEPKGKKRVRKETKDIHEISENSFKRHKSSESDFITLDQ